MRKFAGRAAAALALLSLLLVAGTTLAASTVTIQVVQNNHPIQGVVVEVLASDGAQSFVTDASGQANAQVSGQYFRLKVNGALQGGLHQVTERTITVELH